MIETGYRFDLENRDELFATHTEFLQSVYGQYQAPREIDPRPWHRIEDQGSQGSCVGHGGSSTCEMCCHIATGQVLQFSRMFCYLTAQEADRIRYADKGATISGLRKAVMEYGCCPEEFFPYPERYSPNIPTHCYQEAKPYKIQSTSIIRGYRDAYEYLASGQGAVVIGIAWPDSLKPDQSGRIEQYRPTGQDGGHCVCFLGYDESGYLWLANSWGVGRWSQDGWALVSPHVVDAMGQHEGNVMLGMSDLTTPTPRSIDWTGEGSVFA